MPFLMIKVSGNQRVLVTFNPERIPLHMQSYMWTMCIRIGMRYLFTIHIIAAYTSANKENANPPMSIYIYIYIIVPNSKHICTLDVLIQPVAMAYATSMLPISQRALETSISM